MNNSSSGDRRRSFWPLWIIVVLASPWYPIWVGFSHPDGPRLPFVITYLVILAASLVVVEPRAEARRGSWEWFVETVERGVPLSNLGAILSALIAILAFIAFVFTIGFTG
jgi:hypothetical protein